MSAGSSNRAVVLGLLLLMVVIGSAAQLAKKQALTQSLSGHAIHGLEGYLKAFANPLLLFAIGCWVLNVFLDLFVVSRARIGLIYPLYTTCNYVMVTLLAWMLLGEAVSKRQLVGLVIIVTGLFVFATQPEPPKIAPPLAEPADSP